MRVLKLSLTALAATFAFSTAAEAIEVKKRREAPGTPAEVWAVVGEFCAIKNWHPAVAECEQFEEGGDTYRMLTLGDGGKIKEKLTDKGDTGYSYEIVESPLPVKNYKASSRSARTTSRTGSRSSGKPSSTPTAFLTTRPRKSSPASSTTA
ncbi:MAG: SRPBCC family protein [Methyloceanibacter sp.]|uniref:SRPBCC family protein n=1 Tax=Methyloceanibacter sp. TaxID=1965321 RepID=UPI003D6CEE9D